MFFKVDIEMQCGCSCETRNNDNKEEANNGACNYGFTQCGICKCDKDWGGKFCNCSISTREGQSEVQTDCFLQGDHEPCSGRGECNCGQCKCTKNPKAQMSYSGDYCEYDDFGCEKNEKDKGICNSDLGQGKCGRERKCQCLNGYKGSRCQCPPDDKLKKGQENCQDPEDPTSQCNGHGTCSCEEDTVKCKCKAGYSGVFCEKQTAKESNKCEKAIKIWQPCIECLTLENTDKDFTSGSRQVLSCDSSNRCRKMNLKFVDRIRNNVIQDEVAFEFDERKDCGGSVKDAEHCELFFIVSDRNIHTDATHVYTEKIVNKDNCPPASASLITIIGSVVGVTLLIGILTLLVWKVLTHIHDKREFQRFENERTAASWSTEENRLYKPVVSQFKNPAYSDQ